MKLAPLKRKLTGLRRKLRQARMVAKAMQSKRHPIVAHIIPIRRCNLSCAYCNEYDSFSQPVPIPEMLRRIDMLARLGTTLVTISGGELISLVSSYRGWRPLRASALSLRQIVLQSVILVVLVVLLFTFVLA